MDRRVLAGIVTLNLALSGCGGSLGAGARQPRPVPSPDTVGEAEASDRAPVPDGGPDQAGPAPVRLRIDPSAAAARPVPTPGVLGATDGATPTEQVAAGRRKAWTTRLKGHEQFLAYSTPVRGVPFTKFVLNPKECTVFYFWTAIFPFHYNFVTEVLRAQYPDMAAFNRDNHTGWDRTFVLGSIGFERGVHAFEFLEADVPPPDTLRLTLRCLSQSFEGVELRFKPVSKAQQAVAEGTPEVPWIRPNFVDSAALFQVLNEGRAVGRLRVVPVGQDAGELPFEPSDVVVLAEVPLDIAPGAGILATRFGTPLSHVNLRATAWGIPNAGHKTIESLAKRLDGQVVAYEVKADGVTLRAATEAEAATYELRRAQHTERPNIKLPAADLRFRGLPELKGLLAADVVRVGTKAANLGVLATSSSGRTFDVPPGLVVPFAYYVDHLRSHDLQRKIATLVQATELHADRARLRGALKGLRAAIQATPLEATLRERLVERARFLLGDKGLFVRSSTNAEDLPGFNGAGLYDTVPNVRGPNALAAAVKQVWASLWNLRAFLERQRYGIDHRTAYPAVIVQVGVDAEAAGVLITRNIFRHRATDGIYINAKRGLGIRVVDGRRVPEQVLFDEGSDSITVISRSDDDVALQFDAAGGVREVAVAKGEAVLTEERVRLLVAAAQEARKLFPEVSAALDIEWLVASGRIHLVQARPYVEAQH